MARPRTLVYRLGMTDLPVAEALPRLAAALAARPNAILVAPPGAGKTTSVPLALLDAPWRAGGKILVLEPRRLAARAAANRMAALLGEPVGGRIGFRTRIESAASARTEVEVITEGLLTSRLLSDPGLEGVACVIFDEIHERSLESDLALALVLDLQKGLRPELRVLAMSATLDAANLAGLLEAELVESAGRMFPVDIRHAARDIQAVRDLPEAMARAVRDALAAEAGDILCFLPGMGEIRRAEQALAGCGALVLPLHGDLPPAVQDRALAQAEGRRVVLATSIAETSLTVPGVRIVIDGGFRRAPRLDTASGLSRLATVRISRAAADQRAGRAGREAPGVSIRLWSAALHRGLARFDRPEILEAELSGLVLSCAAWGAAPEALAFPDAPPPGALAAARALLADLGALGADGRITLAGRAMAALRAAPRLGAMMIAARDAGEKALAADLAAILEERDPIREREAPCDVSLRLAALAGPQAGPVREVAKRFRARLGVARQTPAAGDAGALLAAAFPDRIGQRRGAAGSFRLSGGGGASLAESDPLARETLLAIAAFEPRGSRIRIAAPLSADALPPVLAARLQRTRESGFDPVSGAVLTRERLRLGALVLADRTSRPDPAEAQAALAAAAASRIGALNWTEAARSLQRRAGLMRALEGEAWPDLADAALGGTTAVWLAPYCAGMTTFAEVAAMDLAPILRALLARPIEPLLPARIDLPHGSARVNYDEDVPVAEARAQAFYGLDETPRLAGGRIPLRLALLSPAGRPIAITADLAGFWRGGWREARKDMRGRYPRHDWPEEPWR